MFGSLVSLLTLMKSLPLAYNRDMQEDKAPLFDTVDTLHACIDIYQRLLPKLKINKQRMQMATTRGFLNATDMADYLVGRGMPFREAHACVGQAVAYALSRNKELQELTLDELRSFSDLIGNDLFALLDIQQVIDRRNSFGGTATEQVSRAIKKAGHQLKKELSRKKDKA